MHAVAVTTELSNATHVQSKNVILMYSTSGKYSAARLPANATPAIQPPNHCCTTNSCANHGCAAVLSEKLPKELAEPDSVCLVTCSFLHNCQCCRSPLSPWQSVKKSPAFQQKPHTSWPRSAEPRQGSSGKEDVRSIWSRPSAQKLQQQLQVGHHSLH